MFNKAAGPLAMDFQLVNPRSMQPDAGTVHGSSSRAER